MTLRIDDNTITNPPGGTYLQVSEVTYPFPSYYTYKISQFPKLQIINKGPYGSWITYLTRLTFDDITSNKIYAAHITGITLPYGTQYGSSLDKGIERDSPPLFVNQTYTLNFQKPRDQSDTTNQCGSCGVVTPANTGLMYS